MGVTLIKKYAPLSEKEIIGQDKAVSSLKKFIVNFKNEKKKAAFLYGPPGCGKTCSVYALAHSMDLEIIELNASDLRNKDSIKSIVGAASKQMSLFFRNKIILIDEIDGIAGREDYGGLAEVANVVEDSYFPIIITANNPYDNKFSTLRRKSEMMSFNELNTDSILLLLKRICDKEGIKYTDEHLKTLARRSGGDLRGAINDLQIITAVHGDITKESIDELSQRDRTETMLNALVKVFKSTDSSVALNAFENVSEDINEQMLWLDENIPLEYKKADDLCRAYDKMSKADVFLGRIRRWQHWRFLVYAGNLISAGVAASKDTKNPGFVQYKPTGRLLKLWWAKQKSMKRNSIAEKIAEKTHTSTKNIIKDMEFYRLIFKNDDMMAGEMADEFGFDNEETEYLMK